ncbi:MAG TPA: hypothetical protein DCY13_14545 [Verrucomicrobiales bacterium]|nr:hypothetical protein [Verrucomicrobiales bacterium]
MRILIPNMKSKTFFLASLLLSTPLLADQAGPPHKSLVNLNKDGVAIEGYDPVAYFTDGKPVKGDPRQKASHDNAVYYFASAANKATFEAAPERYAPAYGGYCGYAASINRLSPISPDWWQIEDGKLILQHNKKAFDLFNRELKDNVVKADGNWPGLVEKNGSVGRPLVYLDKQGVALGGYDPVTYFTVGEPGAGDPTIEATFGGAKYHFVSQENRATFEKDPVKFVPAYGGFCGYAASVGKVRPADPLLWSIVDGQLIVQHTKGAVGLWTKDVAGNKSKADANWPNLVAKKAGKKKVIDPLYRIAGVIPVY